MAPPEAAQHADDAMAAVKGATVAASGAVELVAARPKLPPSLNRPDSLISSGASVPTSERVEGTYCLQDDAGVLAGVAATAAVNGVDPDHRHHHQQQQQQQQQQHTQAEPQTTLADDTGERPRSPLGGRRAQRAPRAHRSAGESRISSAKAAQQPLLGPQHRQPLQYQQHPSGCYYSLAGMQQAGFACYSAPIHAGYESLYAHHHQHHLPLPVYLYEQPLQPGYIAGSAGAPLPVPAASQQMDTYRYQPATIASSTLVAVVDTDEPQPLASCSDAGRLDCYLAPASARQAAWRQTPACAVCCGRDYADASGAPTGAYQPNQRDVGGGAVGGGGGGDGGIGAELAECELGGVAIQPATPSALAPNSADIIPADTDSAAPGVAGADQEQQQQSADIPDAHSSCAPPSTCDNGAPSDLGPDLPPPPSTVQLISADLGPLGRVHDGLQNLAGGYTFGHYQAAPAMVAHYATAPIAAAGHHQHFQHQHHVNLALAAPLHQHHFHAQPQHQANMSHQQFLMPQHALPYYHGHQDQQFAYIPGHLHHHHQHQHQHNHHHHLQHQYQQPTIVSYYPHVSAPAAAAATRSQLHTYAVHAGTLDQMATMIAPMEPHQLVCTTLSTSATHESQYATSGRQLYVGSTAAPSAVAQSQPPGGSGPNAALSQPEPPVIAFNHLKLGYNLISLLPIDAQPTRTRQAYGMDKVWHDEFERLFSQFISSQIAWTLVEVEWNPSINESSSLVAYKGRYIVLVGRSDRPSHEACPQENESSSCQSYADDCGSESADQTLGSSRSSPSSPTKSVHECELDSTRDDSYEFKSSESDNEASQPDRFPDDTPNLVQSEPGVPVSLSSEFGVDSDSDSGAQLHSASCSSDACNSSHSTGSVDDQAHENGQVSEQENKTPLAEQQQPTTDNASEPACPTPKQRTRAFPTKFRMFIDSAKVRFCCDTCGHGWTSMKGRVVFWYELFELVDNYDEQNGVSETTESSNLIGYCAYKLFGQQCDLCKVENRFERPMWYPEEVTKVLSNLYNKVGQIYFGFKMPAIDKQRRAGKPKTSHNSSLCQACQDGVCADRK